MRIKSIETVNFRTLENTKLEFNSFYTAITGKNNTGKSNILRAIQVAIGNANVDFEKDFSAWKGENSAEDIKIKGVFVLNTETDNKITRFIDEIVLGKAEDTTAQDIELHIEFSFKRDVKQNAISVTYNGQVIESDYKKQALVMLLKSVSSTVLHNPSNLSIQNNFDELFEGFTSEEKESANTKKKGYVRSLQAPVKRQQKELTDLLGKLEEKYDLEVSLSSDSLSSLPLEISLTEKGVTARLENWGSGARNKNLVFMHLFNAKKAIGSKTILPVLLVEQPESFLNPSSQAEFGRVLQDLAEEFKIQVIVSTQSVYMLSHKEAGHNVLIERKQSGKNKLDKTEIINTEGDKWVEPYSLALGIAGVELNAYKNIFLTDASDIILVESDIDKEYVELLLKPEHNDNKLDFKGQVFVYNDAATLTNNIMLKFIKEKFGRFLVLANMDQIESLRGSFRSVGMEENAQFIAIGLKKAGMDNIEGLLPEDIRSKVYSANSSLVMSALSTAKESRDAKLQLEKLLLEEFKVSAQPSEIHYGEFYKVIKKINKVFK